MRKILLISIFILCIANKVMAQGIETDEMIQLAEIVESNHLHIANWQVTMKEELTDDRLEHMINALEATYTMTKTEDEKSTKYVFSDRLKQKDIVEYYTVIIPKIQGGKTEFIAVLQGDFWNGKIANKYAKKVELLRNNYFTKHVKTFACLGTDFDAIMKTDVLLTNLTNNLKLKHINTQFDTESNSKHNRIIYGYTPIWDQKVTIMGVPMNLQIAVVNGEQGKVAYTIGTPILINEY